MYRKWPIIKTPNLNINGKRNFKLKKLTEPNKDSARGSKAANKDTNKKKDVSTHRYKEHLILRSGWNLKGNEISSKKHTGHTYSLWGCQCTFLNL